MNFCFCRDRASVAWDGWRHALLIDLGGKATCLNTIKRLSHHTFCVVEVDFKLVVETADGNKRSEYKPSSDSNQSLWSALTEFEDSVSIFR